MADNDTDWKLLIVGMVFMLIGSYRILDGFITGYQIIKWSNTEGTVLSTHLQECSRGRAGRGLTPQISYSYVINDATYVSYRIAPSHYSECMSDRDAENVIYKYPEQSKVLVHFNAEQPTEAFVFGGKVGHWYDFIFVLIGALLVYASIHPSSRLYQLLTKRN